MPTATLHARPGTGDTVWVERDPLIDRIPRPIAITSLVVGVIGLWWVVTRLAIVSPIILPGPAETGADLVFVASSGMRAFILGARSAKSRGRVFRVAGLIPHVSEVFRVTGLYRILDIRPTLDEALDRPGAVAVGS